MKCIVLLSLMFISCNNDFKEKLPGGFEYIDEGGEVKMIIRTLTDRKEIYIPCIVENYVCNERFILALQKFDTGCYKAYKGKEKLQIGSYYYWIMDIKNDSLYGPLSKTLFKERANLLRVPEQLIIR